jgi:thymidylate synthase (FAD)
MKLLKYLANNNHHTPFGHCFLSFRIKAPIFIVRQLAKHQVGLCWNEVSRRYVDEEPEFFFPKKWRGKPLNSKQGSTGEFDPNQPEYNLDMWSRTICVNALDLYQKCIKDGLAPEQARIFLPQNMMTEWIWSGSLLAFMRICNLRLDSHTQKETQDVAKDIAIHLEKEFPESWGVYKKFNENI